MYDVVVKGGQIVSGSYGSFRADLAIKGEKIAAIGDGLDGKYVINASGKLVMPGVIDAHVHMELPVSGTRSSDDFSSNQSGCMGGVTTIIDFTVGSSESTIPEDIEKDSGGRKSHIDYALHAEVIGWHRSRSQEILKAVQMGVTSFKFLPPTVLPGGEPIGEPYLRCSR